MATNIPSDNMLEDPEWLSDHSSNGVGNLTRKTVWLYKGKSIKQSAGISQDDEPISYKNFEDLAHAILCAIGSWVPEPTVSPTIQDMPLMRVEKQLIHF